jgi:hypothetical protein
MKKYLAIILVLASSAAVAKVDLKNSFLLSPGMSKQEVLELMGGRPTSSEFVNDLAEWHFCKQSAWTNQKRNYTTVFFHKDKLIAMKEYGVQKTGTCVSDIKGGSYREPDVVREYRIKYQ